MRYLLAIILNFSLGIFASHAFASSTKLVHVETAKVCMVTNKVFPTAQIPVLIEGKTYYGCCEMCKGQLEEKPQVRMALDPVSKESIDKSTSYIGADKQGRVYYFKNKQNFQKFVGK